MLEVYSILCMYCNIQLITNIIDLVQIDKSDKGEHSICTLQMYYTRQNRLFIKYVNINDVYHL